MQGFYFDPPFVSSAGIKGRPLQARYERTHSKKLPDGESTRQVRIGAIYRDGEGRSRREEQAEATSKEITGTIIIHDPIAQEIRFLDPQSKTVIRETLLAQDDVGDEVSMDFLEAVASTAEDIGRRLIEGLTCRGYRVAQPKNGMVEYWFSEELQDVVLAKSTGGNEEGMLRLFDISFVEPDSSMFIVPTGYKDAKEAVKVEIPESTYAKAKSEEGGEALRYAAACGDTEAVLALLAAGAEVDASDELGLTPLINAAESGHTDTLKALLAAGADVNAVNRTGITALISAAWEGNSDTAQVLLVAGADPNKKDINGETALTIAASEGHSAIVAALLEKAADVNASDNNGTSALMRAVASRDIETMKALLTAGADVEQTSNFGHTVLGDAIMVGSAEIIQLLKEAGAK